MARTAATIVAFQLAWLATAISAASGAPAYGIGAALAALVLALVLNGAVRETLRLAAIMAVAGLAG
jgi:hypothetical protein